MKAKVLISFVLAAVLMSTTACTKGKSRRRRSTNPTSGQTTGTSGTTTTSEPELDPAVRDKVFTKAFQTNVKVGGTNQVSAGGEATMDPASDRSNLFVVLETYKPIKLAGTAIQYYAHYDYTYTVTVSGETKDSSEYIDSVVNTSDKRTVFFKNWPTEGDAANFPQIKVTATATISGQSESREYTLKMSKFSRSYAKIDLADVYKTGSECLDWMTSDFIPMSKTAPVAGAYGPDTSKYDEWQLIPDSAGKRPTYISNIETYGRVTYYSDSDSNSAILQCGNYAMQIYQLKEYNAWGATCETLYKNVDVIVRAQLSVGYGNIQLSYVDEIIPLPEGYGHTVAPIATPQEISEAEIGNNSWWSNPIFNKVVAPTTVTYVGNLNKIDNKSQNTATVVTPASASDADFKANRYEFDVKVGNTTVTVQTDYHMLESSEAGSLPDTLKSVVTAGEGTSFKLGGTIRWLNSRSVWGGNDYSTRSVGYWEIVPYLEAHASM